MRIGVLSDTHMPERAKQIPQKILDDFKSVDMVIHAGDLVDLDVLKQLRQVCPEVKAVFGNMDPAAVRAELPQKEIITVGKYRIGVMHGYGNPQALKDFMKKEFQDDNVDLIIFGHSHQPLAEEEDGILYFNPGSATDEMFAPYKSYGIIEINEKIQPHIVRI